jgi:hypothetical protein
MEDTMIRLLPLTQSLLCMAVLMSAGAVAVRAGGASLPVSAGSATEVALTSAVATSVEEPLTQRLKSSLGAVSINWSSPTGWPGDNDHQGNENREGDGDDRNGRDHDRDHDHDKPPTPTPEPSTVLSFGVALLIGGGVLLLGRMRETRK